MALDNTRFLNQVKLKASLPTGRFTDQEILDIAYDILLTDAQPFLISLRSEYYTKKTSTTIVSGTATYPINTRALGLSLREVKFTDSAGQVSNLIQLSPEDINESTSGKPYAFYLEGVNLILFPTPDQSATLVQTYFQRVNRPVEATACALVTAIDTITGVVTADIPSGWTTSNTYDFISRNNGNDTLVKDLTPTAVGTTTITFTASDIPASLAVGDYITLAGETPYIQVPDEVVSLVVLLTCADLMESMGDAQSSGMAFQKADRLKVGLSRSLMPRVQGEGVKFRPTI